MSLPASICVNIVGPISYHDGLKHLVANHFFVLPTLGENFGYVIVEALSAACPVIISDRTIWEVISEMNAGRTIPLDARNRWIENIDACVGMGQDQFSLMSRNARQIAVKLLGSPDIELATEQLLTEVMGV